MKKFRLNLLWAVLLGIALFAGCKKEEDEPAVTPEKPSIAEQTSIINVPTANMPSNVSQTVSTYISMANGMLNYTSMFEVPANATVSEQKSTSTTWSWSGSYGGQTYSYWVEYTNDGVKKTWKYYWQGGKITTKTLVMTATEDISGNAGSITINTGLTGGYEYSYVWTLSNGTYSGTLTVGNAYYMNITNNASKNTGSLVVYFGSTGDANNKYYEITWTGNKGTYYIKGGNPATGSW